MKTFKLIDLMLNALLILVFLIASFIRRDSTFIIGYFFVGGWQVISMLVHEFCGCFTEKGSTRRVYHIIVLIILLTGITGLVITPFLLILLPLLFAAPVMAIGYTMMCLNEWKKINRRPLALLK